MSGPAYIDSFRLIRILPDDVTIAADAVDDTLTLVAGPGISLVANASTDQITIVNTGATENGGSVELNGTTLFNIAGDDSTQRSVTFGETIKFTGASNITVTTDTEGNVTITSSITNTQITNWDEAYSWGDHALAGYVTSGGSLSLDNDITVGSVRINTNVIQTIDSNANLELRASGTGAVLVESVSINGTTIDSADSSAIIITPDVVFEAGVTVGNHIVPSSNENIDLGSNTNRFRDLYLSGSTIRLGDATISSLGPNIVLPANTTIGGSTVSALVSASTGSITATSLGLGNVTNESKATMFTSPTFTGTTTLQQTSEIVNVINNPLGTIINHDFQSGTVWFITNPSNNYRADFDSVPTTANRAISFAIIIVQSATPYIPNTARINGSDVTIKWQDNVVPTGNGNKVDLVTFTIVRANSDWTLMGSLSTFG